MCHPFPSGFVPHGTIIRAGRCIMGYGLANISPVPVDEAFMAIGGMFAFVPGIEGEQVIVQSN